jgi:succinoglycan biosynthesis transport protein ExoP
MESVAGYLGAIRRWKWLILLVTVTCSTTAALASLELPRVYETSAVGLVSPKQLLPAGGGNASDPTQEPSIDQLVETYVGLINTEPVRQRLIDGGIPRDTGQLRASISAARQPNTTLITILVSDGDPAVALSITQRVIPAFNASLDTLQSKVGSSPTSHLDALVPWEIPSVAPATPISPNIPRNVALAAVASLVIAVLLALVLERLDDTIKSEVDVRTRLGLSLLGSILLRPAEVGGLPEMMTAAGADEPVGEQYRALRTNVLYTRASKPLRTLLVTSTIPGEGKTTTAVNLAVVMAQAGNRVVLVDADFRKPALHRIFDRAENRGLGNLILGDRPDKELIQTCSVPNLRVVTTGPPPPNPSELIGSSGMKRVIDRLATGADIVIIDSAPVAPVTDAAVLATLVDGIVMVVERGGARVKAIEKALDTLRGVGGNVLGAVMNKARPDDASGYYYYQQYREAAPQPDADGPGPKAKRRRAATAVAAKTAAPGS